jgi:hypothetical protein
MSILTSVFSFFATGRGFPSKALPHGISAYPDDMPTYDTVIPAYVFYDNSVSALARLLYGEIRALSDRYGCCRTENARFAYLYRISEQEVSDCISALDGAGHVKVGYDETGGRIIKISGP